ncbi:MAG: hypothetical protein ACT4O1_11945 [Gemmatimonadota bacterium]
MPNRLVACLGAALLAGCASAPTSDGHIWTGAFRAFERSSASGIVDIYRGSTAYETRLVVALRNLPAGGVVRWRIFEGKCEKSGASVGPAEQMRDVQADGGGSAGANVVLGMRPPEAGFYSVRVAYAQAREWLACAELKRLGKPGT